QAVGIQFTGKGKATSKELLDALSAAGLKGTQYTTTRGASGRSMNGGMAEMIPCPGTPAWRWATAA
ncbi:MAG TPA: hypothetical protein VJ739_19070, partial [Gemmataceae bacterium]|nr:hypothetical protein [Gemmataceae bacterium]